MDILYEPHIFFFFHKGDTSDYLHIQSWRHGTRSYTIEDLKK